MHRIVRVAPNSLRRFEARRGAVVLEFIIAMPVLFTAFLAILSSDFWRWS